jgi:tRNA (mo5U34)-methyltransferase
MIAATPPQPEELDLKARALIEQIAPLDWCETIELGHGVVTPGVVDHRPLVPHYQLPDSLAGSRCLDLGTKDGFWAFEMERRGAAEVVALDLSHLIKADRPRSFNSPLAETDALPGRAFAVAREILGSGVRWETRGLHDLSPEWLGQFDVILADDLLAQLRNPQRALERIRSVCRGTLILAEDYNLSLEPYGDACLSEFAPRSSDFTWWLPNTNTLKRIIVSAGFEPVEEIARFPFWRRTVRYLETSQRIVFHATIPVRHSWRGEVVQLGPVGGGAV